VNLLISLLLFTWVNVFGAELKLPALTSPVMDEASLLSEAERADLSRLAYEIYTNKGPQITILTVNDLQDYPIEDFSIKVVEKWQLGTQDNDNGVLILISKIDRKMRIEVGNGIEGEITDYDANNYVRRVLAPAFKQGAFHAGLKAVMSDMASRFNLPEGSQSQYVRRAAPPAINGPLARAFPFLLIFLIAGQLFLRKKPFARGVFTGSGVAGAGFFLLPGITIAGIVMIFFVGLLVGLIGLHNLLFALAASRGRGGFGGGGFGGGGGWSGGGGGFSGGGSSGSW
jgi:uncharacterized protein